MDRSTKMSTSVPSQSAACFANSLCLLKQYEDILGGKPYKDCSYLDWSSFPGLDPLVATVFEWGHSMDDDPWAMTPSGKVGVSDSTSAAYLLNDRDHDSHTPLLIEVHANQYSGSRMRAMSRNPDTVKEAADRRKARQKANKARGAADPQATPTDPSSPQGEASSGQTSSRTRTTVEKEASPPRARTPRKAKAKAKGRTD